MDHVFCVSHQGLFHLSLDLILLIANKTFVGRTLAEPSVASQVQNPKSGEEAVGWMQIVPSSGRTFSMRTIRMLGRFSVAGVVD